MKRSDFQFSLPDELIARFPCEQRTGSRLLHLDGVSGRLNDLHFGAVLDLLQSGDLLVMNNTRVIPARVFAKKASGGALELLIERVLGERSVLAHMRSSRSPKPGSEIQLCPDESRNTVDSLATVTGRDGALFEVEFAEPVFELLERIGHMPLPPYIDRPDEGLDQQRYQTVYAQHPGAVAAPTAGLHFDESLLKTARANGIELGFCTLHVGAGTFQPVRVDDIREHVMHAEYLQVDEQLCQQIAATRARGGRVVAVGTTSVRCLETASNELDTRPFQGDTSIFIYPGYTFKCVDALITNFHLPESTLIMLVSAFAGREHVLEAYRHAVDERYRFFSYGDAMFVEPATPSLHYKNHMQKREADQ